jgi:hypothetical protein
MKNTLVISLGLNSKYFDTYLEEDLQINLNDLKSIIGSYGYGPSLHTGFLTSYTPSVGDKYYFLDAVTVPRVKLKNLATDYKVKVVRDIKEATHVFGSAKSLDKMTTYNWYYCISTELFKQFYEGAKNFMDDFYSSKIDTALEFYDTPYILCDYNTFSSVICNAKLSFGIKQADWDEHTKSNSQVFTYVEDNLSEDLNHMLYNTVYDESALILHLNGDDALEIDATMYDSLSEMLKSSDADNHTLAMEIMANSHYEKSLLYLELLFCNYSDTLSGSRTKNHVNFKSLVNFLCKTRYYDTGIDDIVNSLRKHGQLTRDRLDIILKMHGDVVERRGNSKYFTVKTISIEPELLAEMNDNYSFQVQEDYEVVASPREIDVLPEVLIETPISNESHTDYFL